MSRTYRFRKDADWLERDALRELVRIARFRWEWQPISRNSKQGRKKLALMHSDAKRSWMNYRGPAWFRREFAQKPYNTRAKNELHRYMRNPDYEVVLESMPHLPYWL